MLMFDRKRHVDFMHLPLDWPRINQFSEYFTVESDNDYAITQENSLSDQIIHGKELLNGYPVRIKGGTVLKAIIWEINNE
jgi:hypothetical protein